MPANRLFKALFLSIACAVVFAGNLCAAQYLYSPKEPQPGHTCTASASGSFVAPEGTTGNAFAHGGGFQVGGGFAVTPYQYVRKDPVLYLTLDYAYSSHNAASSASTSASGTTPAVTPLGHFSALTLDPVLREYLTHRVYVYGLGGFGWLRRNGTETITTPPSSTNPTPLTATENIAIHSGVADFGGGVTVGLKRRGGLALFVEGRYYKGLAVNHTLNLVPVTAGIRW
jgi:hypothetical protein